MEDEDDSGFGPELEWDEEAFSQVDALSQPFFPGSYPRTAPDAAPAAHPALASTSSAARAPSAATDGQDVGPVAKTLPTHVAIAYETPPAPAPSAANLDPSAVDDLVVSTVAEPGLDLADDDGAEGIDTVEEPVETRSLYDRFRKRRRYLSVSDIASTRWCEVQVEYGLIGRRSARPEDRPATIRTTAGKEIAVDKTLVNSRQAILDAGIKVHDRLEKEIAPEVVRVDVVTREDEWGLKLLNTIVSLDSLLRDGMAREVSVWGFIDRFLVLGVIDQLDLERIRPPSPPPDLTKDPSKLDFFFGTPPKRKPEEPTDNLTHRVFISDSKTRVTRTIPRSNQTETSRLQLMLYKYLFDRLATSAHSHDDLWTWLSLSPTTPFSPSFVRQIEPIVIGSDLDASVGRAGNLGEMARALDAYWGKVGTAEARLEIVYRLRGEETPASSRKRRRSSAGQKATEQEQEDIKAAIAASLAGLPSSSQDGRAQGFEGEAGDLQRAIAMSLGQITDAPAATGPQTTEGRGSSSAPRRSKRLAEKADPVPVDASSSSAKQGQDELPPATPVQPQHAAKDPPRTPRAKEPGVIGTVAFQYDESSLFDYVRHAGDFWMGERPAIGVSEDETRRCGYCEFNDGCEWRAAKALEAVERQRAARRAQEEKVEAVRRSAAERKAAAAAAAPVSEGAEVRSPE